MALGARLRLPSLSFRKAVPGVAGVARTQRTIGVDPADARVGPTAARKLVGARFVDLDLAPVAVLAAEDGHRITGGDVGQVGVFRVEDLAGGGVVGVAHLLGGLGMTAAAIGRRYQGGDGGIVVGICVGVTFLRLMAAQTGDIVGGVIRVEPLLVDTRRLLFVAGHARAGNLEVLGSEGNGRKGEEYSYDQAGVSHRVSSKAHGRSQFRVVHSTTRRPWNGGGGFTLTGINFLTIWDRKKDPAAAGSSKELICAVLLAYLPCPWRILSHFLPIFVRIFSTCLICFSGLSLTVTCPVARQIIFLSVES